MEAVKRLFGKKKKIVEPGARVSEAELEELNWRDEMMRIKEKDPELYEIVSYLHIDPIKSIKEKLKLFEEDIPSDIPKIDPETITNKAFEFLQKDDLNKAAIGYICAMDLILLRSAIDHSWKTDDPSKNDHVARIKKYSSALMEISEMMRDRGVVSLHGLIGAYARFGKRAEELLGIASTIYELRMKIDK